MLHILLIPDLHPLPWDNRKREFAGASPESTEIAERLLYLIDTM